MSNYREQVHDTLMTINQAWRKGKPSEMKCHLHPDMVMKFPGFTGEVRGRDALLASFTEFCANAHVLEYQEREEQIDIVGNCAVAGFLFDMLYERTAYRERSTGRDLWVFERQDDRWVAIWRTMLGLSETREQLK